MKASFLLKVKYCCKRFNAIHIRALHQLNNDEGNGEL